MKKSKYSSLLRDNRELRETVARLQSQLRVTFDQILLERQVNNLQEEVKALEKQNQRFKSCSIKGLSRGPLSRDHYVINGAKTFVKKYSIKRMRAQGKKLTTQCIEEHYNTLEPDYQEWCEQEGDLLGYEPAFDLEKDSDFDDFIDSDYLQTLGGYEKEQQEEYDTYLDWDQLWYDDL